MRTFNEFKQHLLEKPGDGYLGPTPIPNPIRMAKDAVDSTNRASAEKVRRINKVLPGSASCLLYTSPSPRDRQKSRMPSSA